MVVAAVFFVLRWLWAIVPALCPASSRRRSAPC
jgi:hypothetical protein